MSEEVRVKDGVGEGEGMGHKGLVVMGSWRDSRISWNANAPRTNLGHVVEGEHGGDKEQKTDAELEVILVKLPEERTEHESKGDTLANVGKQKLGVASHEPELALDAEAKVLGKSLGVRFAVLGVGVVVGEGAVVDDALGAGNGGGAGLRGLWHQLSALAVVVLVHPVRRQRDG